jgi:hypothetical protein
MVMARKKSATETRSILESPLEEQAWPLSPEQDLAFFLTSLEEQFRLDPTNKLPAFEALAIIAAYVWQTDEPSPTTVPVPWWVVDVLAFDFNKYRDAARSNARMTLGEAYQLEGGGQGKAPRVKLALSRIRDIRISTRIAFAQANGIKIEAALQQMADRTGLSLARVREIWELYRERATSSVRNFQTRKTS